MDLGVVTNFKKNLHALSNSSLKVKRTKIWTFFLILVQFLWNVFNTNQVNILWSFSSIEASISEIFAIKKCYFLDLIFVERSAKTACDVSVGQVKKSGKFKTVEKTWKEQAICLQKLQAVVIILLLNPLII